MIDDRHTRCSAATVAIYCAITLSAAFELSACAAAAVAPRAPTMSWEHGQIVEIARSDWLASHVTEGCRTHQAEGAPVGYVRVAMYRFRSEVAWRIVPLPDNLKLNVGDRVRFDASTCQLSLDGRDAHVAGTPPDTSAPAS